MLLLLLLLILSNELFHVCSIHSWDSYVEYEAKLSFDSSGWRSSLDWKWTKLGPTKSESLSLCVCFFPIGDYFWCRQTKEWCILGCRQDFGVRQPDLSWPISRAREGERFRSLTDLEPHWSRARTRARQASKQANWLAWCQAKPSQTKPSELNWIEANLLTLLLFLDAKF